MKKMMMIMVMTATIVASASAMTRSEARYEASNLTDRMARELSLSKMQYDAVYNINYDYMRSMSNSGHVDSRAWSQRNMELKSVLTAHQYNKYVAMSHMYRPTRNATVRNWHSHKARPLPPARHSRVIVVRR